MKNYSWLIMFVVCCAFGLMPRPSYAQGESPVETAAPKVGRTLTERQLDAIVKPTLENCSTQSGKSGRIDAASIIPTSNARAFPTARIAKTLHGIWRGRIIGDSGDVGVDYFWIIDTKNNEALIIAQRSGKQTVAEPRDAATAPKLSYLLCAHEGYFPSKDTPQIQEFVKASDNIRDAPRILRESTGLKLSKERPTLSEMWQGLLAMKYFDNLPYVAYAGGYFKPVLIQRVASAIGPASVSLKWDAEYRGGGSNVSLKYTSGVPMKGVEHAEFIGTTTQSGDFLVSSPGNGKLWKVEVVSGGDYALDFDKVVLGPLQQLRTGSK